MPSENQRHDAPQEAELALAVPLELGLGHMGKLGLSGRERAANQAEVGGWRGGAAAWGGPPWSPVYCGHLTLAFFPSFLL